MVLRRCKNANKNVGRNSAKAGINISSSNNNNYNSSAVKRGVGTNERKNFIAGESLNIKKKRKVRKYHEKLPDFSCLKKLIYEQKKKDNFCNLFSFNDPGIKEKIDKFNKIIENRQKHYNIETKEEDELYKHFCETSTFGYTFIDKAPNFGNHEDIEDLVQHDEQEENEDDALEEVHEKRKANQKYVNSGVGSGVSGVRGVDIGGGLGNNNNSSNNIRRAYKGKGENIFSKQGIIDIKKKDMILDQLKLKFDEFKIDMVTIPQKPIHFIDENGKEKKKLFIFNINNNKKKNEKKRIQIVYDHHDGKKKKGKARALGRGPDDDGKNDYDKGNSDNRINDSNNGNKNDDTDSAFFSDGEDVVSLVNKINDQKESYLYFVVKDNELLLNKNNDYFSIMMHYLCEGTTNVNIQILYYLIMKPPNMDLLLYLILTYYKFPFLDILEQYENMSIHNIVESSFEEISLYDYYYYFFNILEISHEQYYMALELFNGMKFLLNKYNFFLSRMHKNSIFSKAKFVLGMGEIQGVKDIFLTNELRKVKKQNLKRRTCKGIEGHTHEERQEREEQEEKSDNSQDDSTRGGSEPRSSEDCVPTGGTDNMGERTTIRGKGKTDKKKRGKGNDDMRKGNCCDDGGMSLRRKNGTLQYILNTKLDFINYQQINFFNETHWDVIENYYHLNNLDKLVYFTKDLYYKFTKKNIYRKLNEITCEQKHFDKIQIIEYCKKKIPPYNNNVKFMNFLGVYSHSFIWQIYCMQLELFCVLKFKRIAWDVFTPGGVSGGIRSRVSNLMEKKQTYDQRGSTSSSDLLPPIMSSRNYNSVEGEAAKVEDSAYTAVGADASNASNATNVTNATNTDEWEDTMQLFCRKREAEFHVNTSRIVEEKRRLTHPPILKNIEKEINNALHIFKMDVKEKKIENLLFPISVEIHKKFIEKTKYINGTSLNEFIYSEFLSGIDLKLRVFKLKCIMVKIIKIILPFLNFNTLIILKCSRIFLKEDNLIVNSGIPLGLLTNKTLYFLLSKIDETIATKTYSKTIFHYMPPEIRAGLEWMKGGGITNDEESAGTHEDINWYLNRDSNDKAHTISHKSPQDNRNVFLFEDKTKLQKAYSYMIGKIFEETLIDTFTGDKFDYLNFDEEIKNFLACCLEEDVDKRETLENLLKHKCFSDCFDLYINIYDDNINSYKNDKEKAIRLKDLNYINNFDYNIFTIPSDHSCRPASSSGSRQFNTSSQYSLSNS
ncbi:hypothetical protein MKS88_004949 [Plasmodium brasilianum]|uniref:Protein kinase n=2 Tax=Plasmodium (Plasmodium) TaxID=418103 RepID=A0A1A8WBX4_PLAMA|nr:conserved Plasmodium protein, unknown function [Plasmodium malariae]KAI4835733.1 hypothetical protein MKS88_004949 [Plasmodium brasilianum]SBS89513.1 conserved Plasmodium protein, unknown function [Plasmodium malariae]SCP02665.1 conserved Plasmodium protein, unknown function [Plasmodium malariae]